MVNYRVLTFHVTLRRLHNLLKIAVREIIPSVNEIKLLEERGKKRKKLVTIILHQWIFTIETTMILHTHEHRR